MIHLHVHDMYSLLDGYGKPEDYLQRASEIGNKAIAITNHGNCDSALKWQNACKKHNIRPIIGAELYIVPDLHIQNKGEKRGHITILVKNAEGWKNLLNMITISNMEGFYNRPRIDYQTLLDHLNGLIVMTACSNSFLKLQGGEEFFYKLVDTIPNSLFLEVMPHLYQDQYDINQLCIDLSGKTTIPLVATNDCHYILREQSKNQEVLLAIQRKAKWNDPNRWKFGIEGLHLKDYREMSIGFKRQKILSERQIILAMNNTEKIAEMIDFEIPKLDIELPLTKYEKPDHLTGKTSTPDELLDFFCRSDLYPGNSRIKWNDEYEKRYQYELKVIKDKNFSRYFLIVYELLEFCRENNIFYGPGRGSAAGSLICYLLGITQVDPLKWGTLFERFINPERLDFPDIDLDFDKNKTDLIKKHLEEQYGQYNIATINTFGRLEARGVIRDIGRVFELNNSDVDSYAKSIKDDIKASFDTPEERAFSSKYPEEFKLIQELEGTAKSQGQHAAGLIISSEDLRTSSRCSLRIAEENTVINWDMGDSEYVGLMKIDVLKLGTLAILDEAKRLMQQNHGKFLYYHPESCSYYLDEEWEDKMAKDNPNDESDYLGEFEFEKLLFDDPNIFEYISKGETAGIFQLTGYDCTKFCKEIKIENLEDVSAVISIARPGPKETIANDYVLRKNGMKWNPVHPIYEDITKETYGVMVYQEQLMKAMIYLAGFSGADADKIRKIIGKKRDAKEFEPFREAFLKGCKDKKTLNEKQADEFWQNLLHHANYSFNRCVSRDTRLKRASNNHHNSNFTVEEMYLIRNNKEYAQKTGHSDLQAKWKYLKNYGYGLSLNKDGRVRKNLIIDIQPAGKREIWRTTLENGVFIDTSLNHKFPISVEQEEYLYNLKTGDGLYFCCEYEETDNNYSFTKEKQELNKKYGPKCGFPKGEKNPGYINGTYIEYCENIEKLSSECEICKIKDCRLEIHHKDLDRNNNKLENLQKLCVSCHKKEHYKKGRIKRGQKGYPSIKLKIISIEKIGEDITYDITMDDPFHNFVTDKGIITSNSHAISYSIIAYWTAWTKFYFPAEYTCAYLTHGGSTDAALRDKSHLIENIISKGMKIITPKVGISDPIKWIAKDNNLYMPFVEIKGIGEKEAVKCANMASPKAPKKGFFGVQKVVTQSSSQTILNEIKAFDLDPAARPDKPEDYFSINIGKVSQEKKFVPQTRPEKISEPRKYERPLPKPVKIEIVKKNAVLNRDVLDCCSCELRKEAYQVVESSIGIYNVLVLGEGPGKLEDEEGKGFVGDAGDLLWKELKKHNISRRMLHLGNCVKCFPSISKTPSNEQVDLCFNKWMINEIKSMDCKLILALGGSAYYALTGNKAGITKVSGTMEWVEKVNANVIFCVHPSYVLRSRSDENIKKFEEGIKLFSEKFNENL